MEVMLAITIDTIGGIPVRMRTKAQNDCLQYVELTADLPHEVPQDDWQVRLKLDGQPSFFWAPHLTPGPEYIADQHIFRCPAMMAADESHLTAVWPDLDTLKTASDRWYMDLDAKNGRMTLGVSDAEVPVHVLFRRKKGHIFAAGEFRFAFWIYQSRRREDLQNPFRPVLDFYWKRMGEPLFDAGHPDHRSLRTYCERTYHWAFTSWKDTVWQAFEIDGDAVGAPAFIVNVTQSPHYPGTPTWRETLSVWNQAWFSSLRSASGLYRYAQEFGRPDLAEKARLTKELALHMPQTADGLFYSVVATEMHPRKTASGTVWESAGWDTRFFGNSNRNPRTGDIARSPFHILDMSITATYMLRWHRDLESDERLLSYAKRYADGLLRLQRKDGFFPAWITLEGEVLEELQISPETSASVIFLAELYALTGEERFRDAAQRGMNAVLREIVPEGRWEDFETYWSCSRFGGEYLGRKIPRNGMYKQCNFSMYWTAEALFILYRQIGDKAYLRSGRRVLDELLMTQAIWQPPYMKVPVFGGFGVMNADGEWLDARQSLFAGLIVEYGLALKEEEYVKRGIAALRASFVMMVCPENPQVMSEWKKRWPFFAEEDIGFMMENYGHDGIMNEAYSGIGEFTIYDWGNGAASEAVMRMMQTHGNLLEMYGET